MNGAIAVPAVITIMMPKKSNIKISGSNQYFFLTLRNCQSSLKKSIVNPPKKYLSDPLL